jgi:hypothetical protein
MVRGDGLGGKGHGVLPLLLTTGQFLKTLR